jgi:hypothetical protein
MMSVGKNSMMSVGKNNMIKIRVVIVVMLLSYDYQTYQ